jgi:type I restriction enzyme S subunit
VRRGWQEKTIEECFKVKSGDFLPKKKMALTGDIDVYGGNGVTGKHDQYNLTGENIIIGRVGEKCGNVNRVNENIWITDNAFYISEFKEEFDLKFLEYLLNTRNLRETANQSAQPVISYKTIKGVSLLIPPIAEQKQIVAILDEAFEGIDSAIANTEKNLANARELFESYLNAIFTRKGDDWVERQLKDVCVQITDGKHGDCRNEDDSGYFFLSAKDVKQNRLNYENARQVVKEDFEETHRRTRLEPGDVLITNSGTIGRTAIATDNENTYRTTFQKSVAILKPIKELISSEFCRYSLMAHLDEMVGISAGTAQKNLLLRDLRAYRFYMPESVQEQQAIANKLDEFGKETQRLETIYQQKLAALNELKQSILQKAFSGELTAEVGDVAVEQVGAMDAA